MAASGTIKKATGFGSVELTWRIDSQDVSTNQSTIYYRLYVNDLSGEISSSTERKYSVTINGTKVASGTATLLGSGTHVVCSGTTTVTHNADGSKNCTFSFSQEINMGYGTVSASGVAALTAIDVPSRPGFNKFEVYRCDADGTANEQGLYAAIDYYYWVDLTGGEPDVEMTLDFKRSSASSYSESDVLATSTASVESKKIITTVTFPIDYQYDIRMTVKDSRGLKGVAVATLPSSAVILDLKADGKGVSFFKTCEKDGVEIEGQLPNSHKILAAGTDLDNLLTPGFYSFSSETYTTMINCPIGGKASGSVEVKAEGEAGQVRQIITRCSVDEREIWERLYYSGTWKAWFPIYKGGTGSRVLWSGGMLMTGGHTVTLEEKVSEQPNGIVLVFSRYSATTVRDYHFNHAFVHKDFVKAMPGCGSSFLMTVDGTFAVMATKYLYIHDQQIIGNDVNGSTGTGASGVKYENNGFVLRYVLGV